MDLWQIVLAILWLPCGVAAYFLQRHVDRKMFRRWTVMDRRVGLFMILVGPGTLAAALFWGLAYLIQDSTPADW